MTKRSLDWTPEKYQRFLNEKRGVGELREYKPWLTIQDMPSLGRVSRIKGIKTGRLHHLFTDNETRYFYLMEFDDSVFDIREQYPLFNLEESINDKGDLKFDKYSSVNNDAPYILTTTFFITLKNKEGKNNYIARSIKSSYELEKGSILERFELQRRFWESKNVNFGIITEKEIPKVRCFNIEWVHSAYDLQVDNEISLEQWSYLSNSFVGKLRNNERSLRTIMSDFDKELSSSPGTGLLIFKHLIARKKILINMDEKIDISKSVNSIILRINEDGGEVYATGS